jgi:hypothetical protein
VDTVNVGFRALLCPFFIIALREMGHTAIQNKCPRSGHKSD